MSFDFVCIRPDAVSQHEVFFDRESCFLIFYHLPKLSPLHQILFASRIMLIGQCFIFLTPTHLSSEVENNRFYMLHAHFFPRDKKGCRATSHSKNCKASTYQSNRSLIFTPYKMMKILTNENHPRTLPPVT